MKNRNLFWGIFFFAAAGLIIAGQTGNIGHLGAFTIIAGFLLLVMILHSIVRRNYFGIFLPLAFEYMLFQKPLDLPNIHFWLLIMAAAFVSIGFSILFPTRKGSDCCKKEPSFHRQKSIESLDDNSPSVRVNFGSVTKYLQGDSLKSGTFSVSFGSMEIYFDQVKLDPAGAQIQVDCSFGEAKLYIPKTWRVQNNMHISLAEVKHNQRGNTAVDNSPMLTINGSAQFGGVEILYI